MVKVVKKGKKFTSLRACPGTTEPAFKGVRPSTRCPPRASSEPRARWPHASQSWGDGCLCSHERIENKPRRHQCFHLKTNISCCSSSKFLKFSWRVSKTAGGAAFKMFGVDSSSAAWGLSRGRAPHRSQVARDSRRAARRPGAQTRVGLIQTAASCYLLFCGKSPHA